MRACLRGRRAVHGWNKANRRLETGTVNECVYNADNHFPPETKATFSLKTVKTSDAFIPSFLREPDEKEGTEREEITRERQREMFLVVETGFFSENGRKITCKTEIFCAIIKVL